MRPMLLLLSLSLAGPAAAQGTPPSANPAGTMMTAPIAYPPTRRQDLVEDHFGIPVADPYRWLENDVRNDKEVADWVAAQNRVTNAYLATLPGARRSARGSSSSSTMNASARR